MEPDVLEHILDGRMKPTNLQLTLLRNITRNFSKELEIGRGGFATVYKGVLPNKNVAVKRIMNIHTIDETIFFREVDSLLTISHHNIVRFLGFCASTDHTATKTEGSRAHIYAEVRERLLCFEYISNGSLQKHITDELRGLEWDTRYLIIRGICEGLQYLHMEKHIYHMDLKPANILLDDDMVPKITDFGLSRLDEKSHTMRVDRCGTLGYCAPEYQFHGKMSFKSDIYSLGTIIIELVTGHKDIPNNNKNNVLRRWRHRWKKTGKETPLRYEQVTKCVEIALLCQEVDPCKRPFISEIISDLDKMEDTIGQVGTDNESAVGQISPFSVDDMLGIEPLELYFCFELNKQMSCSLQLTNDTDSYIAFNIEKMSPLLWCTQPNKGIVLPRSKCCVDITLQPLDKAPRDVQLANEFIVRSTKVNNGLEVQDVTVNMFNNEIDNVVDELYLDVIFDARLQQVLEVHPLKNSVKRDQELLEFFLEGDNETNNNLKIVSVIGFGGLGKTTLVKKVYNKIKGGFHCSTFVIVGRNMDAKKVLIDILLDLGMYKSGLNMLDERQLINKLREILENKRYLIVIDDIWDKKLWKILNLAFSSSNNFGSRLITTTRIVSVAKLCCCSANDLIYQLEPLSDENSQRLFYKRIFGHESHCPREFQEVSMDILKKCGGVPLAIITIASLLASDQHPKDEWLVLLESIGRGLTEDPSVEEMLRILSLSYYNLPSHLKTCLLYLTMFPEDRMIRKDRVIWMWIAESFVQGEKAEASLFEIGETYFNELVNRNMIQPVYDHEGTVYACQLHDMVLDLISALSSEENFVTVLNGIGDSMSSQSNVRRMSLQNVRKEEGCQATPLKSVDMLKLRSIVAFDPAFGLIPSFSSFDVLRVLDLTGCYLGDHDNLNLRELGSLFHLRYLGLAETGIAEVPEEVGKLQFLQVLDLRGNDRIEELPPAVIKLRRLICLLMDRLCKRLPDGLGNQTSMEVLSEIHVDSLCTVKELGNMKRLRKLGIRFGILSLELEEAFVESLGKLSDIQSLEIGFGGCDMESIDILGERWVPPQSLREFITKGAIKFSRLPVWIRRNPSHLSKLTVLEISVNHVGQDYLELLGRLPALCNLFLWSLCQSEPLLVGAGGFSCLTLFHWFSQWPGEIVFQAGAMPKAERVLLYIGLQITNEEAAGNLGLGNLLSLRDVGMCLHRKSVTVRQAKQAEAELEKALRAHPNSPAFRISFYPDIPADN